MFKKTVLFLSLVFIIFSICGCVSLTEKLSDKRYKISDATQELKKSQTSYVGYYQGIKNAYFSIVVESILVSKDVPIEFLLPVEKKPGENNDAFYYRKYAILKNYDKDDYKKDFKVDIKILSGRLNETSGSKLLAIDSKALDNQMNSYPSFVAIAGDWLAVEYKESSGQVVVLRLDNDQLSWDVRSRFAYILTGMLYPFAFIVDVVTLPIRLLNMFDQMN